MKHDRGGENLSTEVIKGVRALHTTQNKSSVTCKLCKIDDDDPDLK